MEQSRNELQRKNHCKIFVVTAASSPTAGVCLSTPVLRASSRERSEKSDAEVTENFSGYCWSSFLLVPNYPKQEFLCNPLFFFEKFCAI